MLLMIAAAAAGAFVGTNYGMLRGGLLIVVLGAIILMLTPAAYANVDNPTKFDGVHLFHRCPKLTNPIECSGGSSDRAIHHSELHRDAETQCLFDRDLYMYHHGGRGKPSALAGYHGCKLYALDAGFHRALKHMPDTLQEAAERVLSDMGLSGSDFLHVALTAHPKP